MGEGNQYDPFGARDLFTCGSESIGIYRLSRLEDLGIASLGSMPISIRVLLESVLRCCDGEVIDEDHVRQLASWSAEGNSPTEIPFMPSRVVLQDFTGVPAVVDLAAMRSAMQRLGGDPARINPTVPVDLVIDHSVQVDQFGTDDALAANVEIEFQRNQERYEFLRWGQKAFDNFRVVPPNVGIVHQVNLEYLAGCVFIRDDSQGPVAVPDTLVGTDSHTTMINGLGVVGWGVGGIEAEAVMLGQPFYMLTPEVIGMELTGELPDGVTATDMVLTVTEVLRREGVVGKFVEFFGDGVPGMKLADRATIANMAPEYGATMGFFPIDEQTLDYLRRSGRSASQLELVERYAKEQGLFRSEGAAPLSFTKVVSLDLGSIEPSLAGPKRPQDRVTLSAMKSSFQQALSAPLNQRGFELDEQQLDQRATVENNGASYEIGHGAVVIAAITSCTNTSNPSVMVAAGLLARNAVERGLQVGPHVKTSLAPGSRVVTDYLDRAGLTKSLKQLGFHVVGYGCTSCIGNSGPIPPPVAEAVTSADLVASAVISGNRNFEGRVNALVKANYLASPPLVVAYALAGTVDLDLTSEPLGLDPDGNPVMLSELWPSGEEIDQIVESSMSAEMFVNQYSGAMESNERWNQIAVSGDALFDWQEDSTYIQEPPFLIGLSRQAGSIEPIRGARVLMLLGDSVTTDHISPAGGIAKQSPAGEYLIENGVEPLAFNSYGSRRGNDRVMLRGTFANIRIRNQLLPGTEGGVTRYLPGDEQMTVYEAAMKYQQEGVPLVVLAGTDYGMGSSRDWAAKGTYLMGVRAVIAASYERIHRSNLVGMGVLPLELLDGASWQDLGLTGEELYDIEGLDDELQPRSTLQVVATAADGTATKFQARVRIDSSVDLDYYRNGGILQAVLRKMLDEE